jgi:hypothetical protein
MKVVSRTPPGGAFIYLQGYDAAGVEKVRVIYYTYDNWDTPTGTPGEHTVYGDYPYYSLKESIGEPPLDTWVNVDQNPRDEFEARFPGVWEKLNLTKIRLDLNSWCNGEITSRYDDVKISGIFYNPVSYLYLYSKHERSYTPNITSQRINPTKYQVHVNTTQPFSLVLSESYHPLWRAYYGKTNWIETFFKKPIGDDNHFEVNGYANAWYIDKVGDYDITLYFKTQSMFYIGVVISGLGLIGGISYIGWSWRRRGKG